MTFSEETETGGREQGGRGKGSPEIHKCGLEQIQQEEEVVYMSGGDGICSPACPGHIPCLPWEEPSAQVQSYDVPAKHPLSSSHMEP
jgi:hypothetical protein